VPDDARVTDRGGRRKPGRGRLLVGDLAGGLTAAILTLPVSMGYGMLAMAPLGDAYVAHGVRAGLYSAIVVPLVAVALGARTPMAFAPRSVVVFLLGSVTVHNLVGAGLVDLANVSETVSIVCLVVLLGGAFQALLGALRLGSLVQYVPFPVMAGFQNAAAVLILFSQLGAVLGFSRAVPPGEILAHLTEARPLSALVALVTAATMLGGARLTRRVPPIVSAVALGTGAYYLIAWLAGPHGLGPTIGRVPTSVPQPDQVGAFASLLGEPRLWAHLPALLTAALSLAIVASLDGLLCAKTVMDAVGGRSQGNRELLRLGLGNVAAACFGAISGGVNLGASFAALRGGARSAAAVVVTALTILLAVVALGPVMGLVPRAVIAGMLAVVAIQLVDDWTVQLARQVFGRRSTSWTTLGVDLAVILGVATVAIAVDLVAAVGIGVAVTAVSFLATMSRSAVRRVYAGDTIHSRKARDPRLAAILAGHGRRIVVFELEGPIFFGTAESLAGRVDAAVREGATHVVLDLKRVSEVDSTGAKIIEQMASGLGARGAALLLSHVGGGGRLRDQLAHGGALRAVTSERVFLDTDHALEWAEDRLIADELRGVTTAELPLERLDTLAGLEEAERRVFTDLLERRAYRAGEVVFREGDEGRELFMIVKGTASVRIRLPGHERDNRLATFSPGTVFGEVALLDAQPRSATIRADDELVCYVLSQDAFETLKKRHEAIAIKLLANLARELSARLRRANRTISQLEA